jgi:NADPH:quinone reductase-like Zn-dependent oxidoreductase
VPGSPPVGPACASTLSARERPHRGGHYAEFVVAPVDATYFLPNSVDFDAAATLANYQVAYHMFNHAVLPQRGQSVLIYAAAGGMGNALIDLAKMADLIVVGVISGEEKSRFARDFGADHIIDRKVEKIGKLPGIAASTSSSILSRDDHTRDNIRLRALRPARPLRRARRQSAT